MSASQREKGARGERELFSLLSGELGTMVQRRLDSPRNGGSDCVNIPGWSIEVKRAERFLEAFWRQAAEQAKAAHCRPVLFWRKSRQAWTAFVDLHDLAPERFPTPGFEVGRISLPAFAQLVRDLAA